MRLAVMQPYLFPYIGYFQLIYASDLFLVYDDVSYIKQGYINRNRLLSANGVTRFTVPVPGASPNKLISDLTFSADIGKVLKTIEQCYSKAPYFEPAFSVIREVLESRDRSIASMCQKSYRDIFSYLGLERTIKATSSLDYQRAVSPQKRLIMLCHKFGAGCYINSPGGRSLYAKEDFAMHGIELTFIESMGVTYTQGRGEFVPNLSIIDVLMNCSPGDVINLMKSYVLV